MQDQSFCTLEARAGSLIDDHDAMLRRLVALRQENNLTQSEVAERMGVSQPAVSQFERTDANPTLDTVRRYAMAVGARLETRVINDFSDRLENTVDQKTNPISTSA